MNEQDKILDKQKLTELQIGAIQLLKKLIEQVLNKK